MKPLRLVSAVFAGLAALALSAAALIEVVVNECDAQR